jgi:poly(A) polymerase
LRIRYSTEKNGRPVKKAIVYTRDEHGINFADVDKDAAFIVERLRSGGYETYIVGGAVRDLILGKKPKDFDIVSAANPTRIKKIFRNARIIGRRFRLVHVYFGPKIFEVSTFRSLKDGPTSNTYGTIEEDVLRRDFSLNALFYDPQEQVVVDYVGGMKDIRNRRIRPIIPLGVIFRDDPVRMIRAVKYAAATGCKLPLLLRWKIREQSALLKSVSPSRLTEEILKIIYSSGVARIVESLTEFGLYGYLQPEASALMREKGDFRLRYIKTMTELGRRVEEGLRPGESLAALVRDYLEDCIQWDADVTDTYKTAFMAARRFVLPMNPPRVELDQGVRLIFGEHGIAVKRAHFFERTRPGFREKNGTPTVQEPRDAGEGTGPKKRRRRRYGRSSPAPEGAGE